MAQKIKPYRFRSFGEIMCFIPLAIVGAVLFLLQRWNLLLDEACTWTWGITLFVCILAACIDMNWIAGLVIFAILALAVPAAGYFGILLEPLVNWIFNEGASVNTPFMLFVSKMILIIFTAIWIVTRITFYDVTPNQIESVVAGQRDWTENMAQVSILVNYNNVLKLLLFGMGDILVQRGGQTIHTIEDIPFLLWWRWSHIEARRKQLAVTMVSGPEE